MSTALEMARQQIADYESFRAAVTAATPMPDRIAEWGHLGERYAYYGDLMLARWIVEQSEASA
jgi:hypothetical protein